MRTGRSGSREEDTTGGSAGSGEGNSGRPLSRGRERLLRRIATRRGREAERVVLLEGPRVIATALDHGARLSFALVPDTGVLEGPPAEGAGGGHDLTGRLVERLGRGSIEIVRLPSEEFVAFSGTEAPQGILAVAAQPEAALPDPPEGVDERWLVLDGIQDPGNVGALIRTAAALGVQRVVALDGTADPWGERAVRASAGTVFALPVHVLRWKGFVARLPDGAPPLLVADAGGRDVRSWLATRGTSTEVAPGSWALLLGNEGSGPRAEAFRWAAGRVAVPIRARMDSLNVAGAGAILLWALGPGSLRTGVATGEGGA